MENALSSRQAKARAKAKYRANLSQEMKDEIAKAQAKYRANLSQEMKHEMKKKMQHTSLSIGHS